MDEWIDVKGKHEPLIPMETYLKAQAILKKKYHVPYQLENGITNPLAGLIKCALCGSSMVYRPYTNQKPHIMCYNKFCDNKSSRFEFIERELIKSLEKWLNGYKLQWDNRKETDESNKIQLYLVTIKNLQQELKQLETQKNRLHDLLERGIYDEETYIQRSNNIANRLSEVNSAIDQAMNEMEIEKGRIKAKNNIIPMVENVISLYQESSDPKIKNTLLKSVLDRCEYRKEKWQTGDHFTLRLYQKI